MNGLQGLYIKDANVLGDVGHTQEIEQAENC
jgi:hypothetical protein